MLFKNMNARFKVRAKGYRPVLLSLLAMILIFGSGCEKFLTQYPQDSLTEQQFFRTKEDANASIVSVYDQLQDCVDKFLVWGEVRADLTIPVTRKNDYTWPYELTYQTDLWASRWGDVYQVVSGANIVILRVPPITQQDNRLTKAESDVILGEAHFLRALAYFYLVRTFGDVPLVLEAPSTDQVNFNLPKSSAAVILAQIESDLTIAEASVPLQFESNVKTRGRATKGAVNALQADVFLWQAKYEQAAAAAKKVIDNKALYELVSGANWFDIFSIKNTREGVFEVQFDALQRETNSLANVAAAFLVNPSFSSLFDDPANPDKVRGLDATYNTANNGKIFWKAVGLSTGDLRRSAADCNFIVYRLADVMLMRAEALSHLDDESKAESVNLINAVRTRANLPAYDINTISTDANTLVDLILNERALELSMEGKRWFDLVRVGRNGRPEVLIDKIVTSRLVSDRPLTRARVADPRSWYLPFHRDELAANPSLVQNPYYR